MTTPASTTATESAVMDATTTDGVGLDWTNIGADDYHSTILFKDGISDFDSQRVALNGTGTTTVTTGFQPDVVMVFSNRTANDFSQSEADFYQTIYDRVGNTYISTGFRTNDNNTTPQTSEAFQTNQIIAGMNTVANIFESWTLGTFTSTGFDFTKSVGSAALDALVVSMKLSAGFASKVGTFSAPTTTGVHNSVTGLDHQPDIVFFLYNGQTAVGTNAGRGGTYLGVACSDGSQNSIFATTEDFTSATNADVRGGINSNMCLNFVTVEGTQTRESQARMHQFNTDGFDLYFEHAATGILVGYLTIGPTAGGSSIPAFMNSYRQHHNFSIG